MRKSLLSLLLLFIIVILSGCFNNTIDSVVESDNKNEPIKDNINIQSKEESVVKKFYPKSSDVEKSTSDQSIENSNEFVITQELEIKIYLVDKYNPGICYGTPSVVPQSEIAGVLKRNQGLVLFIKGKYGLDSDLDIYNKIRQINSIQLDKTTGGKYIFSFVDGQCCVLNAYQGEADIVGRIVSDKIINHDIMDNPC